MSVILVRHTRLSVAPGICYGATDLDVADSFANEAQQVVEKIAACDALISSPLQRCRKLAEKIALRFGVSPQIDQRVTEMDFGSWEGLPWANIPKCELDAWTEDFMHARPHGGDSVSMLQQRVRAALDDYRGRGGRHVVVCHAGVIKAALATGEATGDFDFSPGFGGLIDVS